MRIKSCPAVFKAAGTTTDGQTAGAFEAIVSVFDNIDYAGDVVRRGAFVDSLEAWKSSGDSIPVLWSHRMDDPTFNIGTVVDAAELEPGDARIPDWAGDWVKAHGGLWVHGLIDTGPDASAVAVQAHKLLVQRRVKKFSYAYDVKDAGLAVVDGIDVYELRKLDIFEVSPTQVGANDLTELLTSKSARPEGATLPPPARPAGLDPITALRLEQGYTALA